MSEIGLLILEEPELFIDDEQKLINLYTHLAQAALEYPGSLVIFKLNDYERD